MLEAAQLGLQGILAWPAFGFLLLGIGLGVFFGMVPGLSGLSGMAILLPFTFDLQPYEAMALLMGMYAITSTSDTISSVLLEIPGTAGSQATIMDGYPLAKKGEAARAFGAAYTVSAFGGVIGAILLVCSIPILSPLVLSFGAPEFFLLGVLGMAMVGALSGNAPAKGILVGLLALQLSMIGYSPQDGIPRFWFGAPYLLDGLPIVPCVLGLFSLPEVIELAVRRGSLSEVPEMGKWSHGRGARRVPKLVACASVRGHRRLHRLHPRVWEPASWTGWPTAMRFSPTRIPMRNSARARYAGSSRRRPPTMP